MRAFSLFRAAALAVIALMTALSLAPAQNAYASGEGYVLVKIAAANDEAPDPPGGTFNGFLRQTPELNNGTQVVFEGTVTGGSASQGIFLYSGGTISAVVLEGQTHRDVPTFGEVHNASLNNAGDVAFTGDFGWSGIFLYSRGSTSALVLQGQTAPGPVGGIFWPAMTGVINDSTELAFSSGVSGGTVGTGIFLGPGESAAIIAIPGDPAPGTGGGTFTGSLSKPTISNNGEVAFVAGVTGGTAAQGIFSRSGGTTSARALSGDPAPSTGGGTFQGFGGAAINDAGEVAFGAYISGGTTVNGIFIYSEGTIKPVVLSGDDAPCTGGGTLAFGNFDPSAALNAAGDVAFRAEVDGGSAARGVFLYTGDAGDAISCVALQGDGAPGTGGILWTLRSPSVNDKGELAFRATITGGSGGSGIFLALPAKDDSDGDGLTNEDEVSVHGSDPTNADTDADGCGDGAELDTDETQGGLRDPLNPWDFYDTNADRVVDLFNDIVGVILRFGLGVGDGGYDPAYDRGPSTGPNEWNMTEPDGIIDLFNDIVGVIQQAGHDCR